MSTAVLERPSEIDEMRASHDLTEMKQNVGIVMATGNRGDHAKGRSIRTFLDGVDIAGITEMQSEEAMRNNIKNSRQYGLYQGNPGIEHDEASVIVWRQETIRILGRHSYPLLPEATRDGKHNMSKHLLVVRAQIKETGDEFWFWVYHQLQTLGAGARYKAASEATREINRISRGTNLPVFGCGDFNAVFTHRVMSPFHKDGWHCDSTMRPDLNTFGKRDIDYFVWRNLSRNPNQHTLQVTKHWTEPIDGSDHEAKKIKVLVR